QIVATTHSPYLLDLFEPDEVRVMALDAHGHAVCRNLAEAPDLDRLKQAYQTGEIWASIWEDWALEGATGGA
ncbi:MAG: ATP-binding protein, partial [Deltaproteobacteria bacterium]|nr:ATP-binding protein [Deltaproteobacteria bacterium]